MAQASAEDLVPFLFSAVVTNQTISYAKHGETIRSWLSF